MLQNVDNKKLVHHIDGKSHWTVRTMKSES